MGIYCWEKAEEKITINVLESWQNQSTKYVFGTRYQVKGDFSLF